jgi:hypothetical protein
MSTSSNFGNMFSAGGASLLLSFLPMLPTQIPLNNLLYDASEMTIPTDNVDEEQLQRPAHWDTTFIRRLIGALLPFSPLAPVLGFTALPAGFLAALVAMILVYLVLIELGKRRFYHVRPHGPPIARPRPDRQRWIHRRASRWTTRTHPHPPIPAHPT